MARDTQYAVSQIGDTESKERGTDKRSPSEGEKFHPLDIRLRNAKTTPIVPEPVASTPLVQGATTMGLNWIEMIDFNRASGSPRVE
jgi:hypothetical protein